MLPVEQSNHLFASFNETPFYLINNKVQNHEFLSLLEFEREEVEIAEKSPWTIINFKINNGDKRTIIWKIHVSATIFNYRKIFKIVTDYCLKYNINFKFLSNFNAFKVMNSKSIDRVNAGKFIVLYPREGTVIEVLEDLYLKTKKFEGPQILTDRAYKKSKILHYRYGEYRPIAIRNEKGMMAHFVRDKNNQLFRDIRVPYYSVPDWIEDLPVKKYQQQSSLFLSKYSATSALHFSASGGVYKVQNSLDEEFIAKEARAYCGIDDAEMYGTDRLKRELNFLTILGKTGITPKVYDWIEEFGNYYLIEEEIKGTTLREFIYRLNPLLSLENDINKISNYYKSALAILEELIENLKIIHEHKIILSDISDNNIIVENLDKNNFSEKDLNVRFIDLEHSFFSFENADSQVQTPGFKSSYKNYYKRDYDKIMSLGLAMVFPLNALYELDTTKKRQLIIWAKEYLNEIPMAYIEILENHYNSEKYHDHSEYNYNTLYKYKKNDIKLLIDSIIDSYNESWKMEGYYYPADPHIFNTNPFSISHGVSGVLYGLDFINSNLNLDYGDYINMMGKKIATDWKSNYIHNMPSGLLIGNGGMLLVICKLGFIEETKPIIKELLNHPIPNENNIFYGKAGIIITLLYYFEKSNNYGARKKAIEIADLLIQLKPEDSDVPSMFEGDAGIAVALLTVYQYTKDVKYLLKANEFKKWVMTQVYKNSRNNFTVNRLSPSSGEFIESSFLYNGIAGVGMMLLFFYKVTNDETCKILLERIVISLQYRIQHFPGMMRGLSGIIDFLITCYQENIGNKKDVKKMIEFQISTLKLFEVNLRNEQGKSFRGFPGEQLMKISHDLYTGTAGIVSVISRWLAEKNGKKIPSAEPTLNILLYLLEGRNK